MRLWTKTEKRGSFTETYVERADYFLLDDGELIWQERNKRKCLQGPPTYLYWEDEESDRTGQLSDNMFTFFDYEQHDGDGALRNEGAIGRLRYHAKGVGLSKLLKAVLERHA